MEMRGSIDSLLTNYRGQRSKEVARQAKLFASMLPEEAARILGAMDDASLVAVLGAMNARAASKLMGRLDPRRLSCLTMEGLGASGTAALEALDTSAAPALFDGSDIQGP